LNCTYSIFFFFFFIEIFRWMPHPKVLWLSTFTYNGWQRYSNNNSDRILRGKKRKRREAKKRRKKRKKYIGWTSATCNMRWENKGCRETGKKKSRECVAVPFLCCLYDGNWPFDPPVHPLQTFSWLTWHSFSEKHLVRLFIIWSLEWPQRWYTEFICVRPLPSIQGRS
jgi:hypothetical protein